MAEAYKQLVERLRDLPDVTVELWKDSDLLCVYFHGKEIAHFQGQEEIDIRLTPKIIRQNGLVPPADSTTHPKRSKNSRWLLQSLDDPAQIERLVELVQMAATLRADGK